MDRLAAYYDAVSGKKAEEDKKRIDSIIRSIEEGQVLNHNIIHKLDERQQKVLSDIDKKGMDVKKINDESE